MSDLRDALAATDQQYGKNPISKKADSVFGRVLNLRKAVKSSKPGKSAGNEKRPFAIDVSPEAEKMFGSLRSELASACKILGLANPLLDQFQITTEIELTTGVAIWELMETNKFWAEEQPRILADCRDKSAKFYLDKIYRSGTELRSQLNRYASLVVELQTDLPDDMQKDLQQDVQVFIASVDRDAQSMRRKIEIDASDAIREFVKSRLKIEKDIIKYRASKGSIVIINLGLIAGHIAHSASSFGATAPLGVVATIRSVVTIGQVVTTSIRSMESIGKQLDAYVDIVTKVWGAKSEDASKLRANVMEGLSGFVSGVLNFDLPNVETIKKLLNDYRHKLNTLTKSYDDLGFELDRLRRIMEGYSEVLNKFSPRLTEKQRSKVNLLIDGAEATYSQMHGKALGEGGKLSRIDDALKNIDVWTAAIDKLEEKTSEYMKWVGTLTKIATSAGLGLGDLGGELAAKTAELAQVSAELAQSVHEHAVAALIEALNDKVVEAAVEVAEAKLDLIGEAITVLVADAGLENLMEKLGEITG